MVATHSHQWFMSETLLERHTITYVNACERRLVEAMTKKKEAKHHPRRSGCFSSDHSSTGSHVSYQVFGCVAFQQFRYQRQNPVDNRILCWHLLALDPKHSHFPFQAEGSTDNKDLNASQVANSQRMHVPTHGTTNAAQPFGASLERSHPAVEMECMLMWPDKIPWGNQDWSCLDDRTCQVGNSHHPYFWNLRHLARATGLI